MCAADPLNSRLCPNSHSFQLTRVLRALSAGQSGNNIHNRTRPNRRPHPCPINRQLWRVVDVVVAGDLLEHAGDERTTWSNGSEEKNKLNTHIYFPNAAMRTRRAAVAVGTELFRLFLFKLDRNECGGACAFCALVPGTEDAKCALNIHAGASNQKNTNTHTHTTSCWEYSNTNRKPTDGRQREEKKKNGNFSITLRAHGRGC